MTPGEPSGTDQGLYRHLRLPTLVSWAGLSSWFRGSLFYYITPGSRGPHKDFIPTNGKSFLKY